MTHLVFLDLTMILIMFKNKAFCKRLRRFKMPLCGVQLKTAQNSVQDFSKQATSNYLTCGFLLIPSNFLSCPKISEFEATSSLKEVFDLGNSPQRSGYGSARPRLFPGLSSSPFKRPSVMNLVRQQQEQQQQQQQRQLQQQHQQ